MLEGNCVPVTHLPTFPSGTLYNGEHSNFSTKTTNLVRKHNLLLCKLHKTFGPIALDMLHYDFDDVINKRSILIMTPNRDRILSEKVHLMFSIRHIQFNLRIQTNFTKGIFRREQQHSKTLSYDMVHVVRI